MTFIDWHYPTNGKWILILILVPIMILVPFAENTGLFSAEASVLLKVHFLSGGLILVKIILDVVTHVFRAPIQ